MLVCRNRLLGANAQAEIATICRGLHGLLAFRVFASTRDASRLLHGDDRARLRAHGGALRHRRRARRRRSGRVVRAARPRDGGTAGCQRCARAATGCARQSGTPGSTSRSSASPSISRRPTSARRAPRSICRLRWACSPPRARWRGASIPDVLVLGELSLDGSMHPTRGVLPIAATARRVGYRAAARPVRERGRSCGRHGPRRAAGRHAGRSGGGAERSATRRATRSPHRRHRRAETDEPDLADVHGQALARRALEVAAAGGHNLLFVGPPGAGKTMMARRLPGLLPPLSFEEALEVTTVHSVAGPAAGRRRPDSHTAVPRAAPHDLRHGARRRRSAAASRRDQPRASRRAVPRRAAGVLPPRAGSAAAAGRARHDHDRPRGADGGVPRALHAGRRDEPVSRADTSAIRGAAAAVPRPSSRVTRIACPVRSATASTSSCRSPPSPRPIWIARDPASRRRHVRERVLQARQRQTAPPARRPECAPRRTLAEVRRAGREPAARTFAAQAVDRLRLSAAWFLSVCCASRAQSRTWPARAVVTPAHVAEALQFRGDDPT